MTGDEQVAPGIRPGLEGGQGSDPGQEASMVLAGKDTMANAEDFLAGISTESHPNMVAHIHHHLSGETESSFALVLDLIQDGLVRLNA